MYIKEENQIVNICAFCLYIKLKFTIVPNSYEDETAKKTKYKKKKYLQTEQHVRISLEIKLKHQHAAQIIQMFFWQFFKLIQNFV